MPKKGPAVCEKISNKDLTPRELEEIKYFNQDFKRNNTYIRIS